MRIEGTYTFPTPIEQVLATVTHPDLLGQIIPGCERLVQLGPAADGQMPVYEVRLRRGPGADVYTMSLTLGTGESPTRLRVELDGRGPDGPFSGHGVLDFESQDGHTLVNSAWEIKSPVLAGSPSGRQSAWNDAAEQFAGALRDRAASIIHGAPDVLGASAGEQRLRTARGSVVILPRNGGPLAPEQRALVKRVAWLGGGLLVGLVSIGIILAVVRRLSRAGSTSAARGSSASSDT